MSVDPVETLQAALAGEHAAIYGYGVVGARLDDRDLARARSAYDAHRVRRGLLEAILRGRNATPVAAQPAYALPFPVTDQAAARRLAGLLEERLAAVYADVVYSGATARETAAQWLGECAVRGATWTGTTVAFPGMGGPPDE